MKQIKNPRYSKIQNGIRKIVVIAEYMENQVRPITDELIFCAIELSSITGFELEVVQLTGIDPLESEKYKTCLYKLLKNINPAFILMGHTSQGIDVAPGLALRLGCTCITGVNKLSCIPNITTEVKTKSHAKKTVLFSRSVFNGKLNAVIKITNPEHQTLLTIQPGSFSANIDSDTKGSSDLNSDISHRQYSAADLNMICNKTEATSHCPADHTHPISGQDKDNTITSMNTVDIPNPGEHHNLTESSYCIQTCYPIEYGSVIKSTCKESKLNQAKIIVTAGRGIGVPENLSYIEKLAACFTGSAVAGSRPLIDMGWLPYEKQVGVTGAVVSPGLYMALGISGSSQHVAGMKDSKFIVSVNKDPKAAIFNVSDLCIVENLLDFIESFIELSAKQI